MRNEEKWQIVTKRKDGYWLIAILTFSAAVPEILHVTFFDFLIYKPDFGSLQLMWA